MSATLTLLDLAGSVALLLWGVHMVQSGIHRAFGPSLRRALGLALSNRLKAFLVGASVTAVLQSSTATGLMVASFGKRPCLARAGAGRHAGRERRDDPDRPGALLRHRPD